jgi:hypothetical protein
MFIQAEMRLPGYFPGMSQGQGGRTHWLFSNQTPPEKNAAARLHYVIKHNRKPFTVQAFFGHAHLTAYIGKILNFYLLILY